MSYNEEKKSKKSRKLLPYLILALLFGVGAAAGAYVVYYSYAIKKVTKRFDIMIIPTGTTFEEQTAMLYDQHFLTDTADYVRFAKKLGYDRVFPGRYIIDIDITLKQLFRVIGTGWQKPVRLSFNNIRNFNRLADVVSKKIEADSASLMAAFNNDSIQKANGFNSETFITMFIPNTYEFLWNNTAEGFINRMKTEYDAFWAKNNRLEKAKKLGMTPVEVSILASIIIEETKAVQEFERIAGVYVNRLKSSMPLQADPTVKFALGDPTLKRVLYKHLEVDSPYNTYKHAGLPPGAIYMPPIATIDAVLNHEKHDYYYFCAAPELNGTHRFAKTLTEHNRNAAAYAAALNKRGIR